jgi:hypothetical protein
MTTDRAETAPAAAPAIPVRVTRLENSLEHIFELGAAQDRGGLLYDEWTKRWWATQGELDTPHATFNVRPR